LVLVQNLCSMLALKVRFQTRLRQSYLVLMLVN
jgi:hypothetical protein